MVATVALSGGAGNDDFRLKLLGGNAQIQDRLGLGRIPMFWYTQNSAYNSSYDIHRLNTVAPDADAALVDEQDTYRQVRYNFVRDRPNHVSYMIALRAELNMRMVMRSVVPHSDDAPFLAMERFE